MTFVQVRDASGRASWVPEHWLEHPVLGEDLTLATSPLPADCCGAQSAPTPDIAPEED